MEWTFGVGAADGGDIDGLRFAAVLEIGLEQVRTTERGVRRLIERCIRGDLLPRQLQSARTDLQTPLKKAARTTAWLVAVTRVLDSAEAIGYLRRYEVLQRAAEAGIQVTDELYRAPYARLAKSHDNTSALPLKYIGVASEIHQVIESLRNREELQRVFGRWADLDLLRSGALASIVVTELGANVTEHSDASRAWLCTRLINLHSDTGGRPDHLEVIVCDNGKGLTYGLANKIESDRREHLRDAYFALPDAESRLAFLTAYAFDRFTSTKRDLLELMNLADGQTRIVSSGLYWIWNLLKRERGVLIVRTEGAEMTFLPFASLEPGKSMPIPETKSQLISGGTMLHSRTAERFGPLSNGVYLYAAAVTLARGSSKLPLYMDRRSDIRDRYSEI